MKISEVHGGNMHIREAHRDDFDAIRALMQELNPADKYDNAETRRSVYLQIIDDPANYIFVGLVENVVVTTCYLNIIPNITWKAAPYALIENVVTAESQRRKGYGRACLKHAIEFSYDQGCFKVMLLSSQRNERTREFYDSVGLKQSKDGYAMYKEYIA